MKFTVLLTPDLEDGGYVAECPTIPGCFSEGDAVETALANIKGGIEGCLESLTANQQPLPKERPVVVATVEVDVSSFAEQKLAQGVKLVEQINALIAAAKTVEDFRKLAEL